MGNNMLLVLLAWLVRGYEGGAVVILMGKKIESCVFQSLFHLYEMCPKTVLFYLFQYHQKTIQNQILHHYEGTMNVKMHYKNQFQSKFGNVLSTGRWRSFWKTNRWFCFQNSLHVVHENKEAFETRRGCRLFNSYSNF